MFLLPFALAIAWEIRVRRVATVEQLREESRLPVIGEITALPSPVVNAGPTCLARALNANDRRLRRAFRSLAYQPGAMRGHG